MLSKQEYQDLVRQVESDLELAEPCKDFEEMELLAGQVGRRVSQKIMERLIKAADASADSPPSGG